MIFILMLMLSAGLAVAKEPFGEWKYRGQVEAPNAHFVALPLNPQNLDLCDKPDLSDIRITDERGMEIPYAVVCETESRSETERRGAILNREYPDPSTSRLTVDFGSGVTKNRITVETEGASFRRRCRIEGSDDLQTWSTLLPEGWLLAAGVAPETRFESLDIGANTYRYIRVSVGKMPEESSAPRIRTVICRHVIIRKPAETETPSRLLQYRTAGGASTAEIDFGHRNLPLQRLQLILERNPERIFEKQCNVWGRDSLQHTERVRFETQEYGRERTVETAWAFIGSASVYRNADGNESLDLHIRSPFRYIRIRIANGDSPPLELSGVVGYSVPAYVVFEPANQSRFVLYAGNPNAPAPRYESANVLASLDTRNLQKCRSTELEQQLGQKTKAPPEGQRFVWVVLAVVFAVTLWLLWIAARTVGKDEASASR